MTSLWLIILGGLLSIVYGAYTVQKLMQADAGNKRMQEIAAAIARRRAGLSESPISDHRRLSASSSSPLIWFLLGDLAAIGFLIGAVLSGRAGFIGMNVSVRANVRTAQAATDSLAAGLDISFKAGAVTGMLVAGLALLGVVGLFRPI